jgi:hypothetical protein
MTCPNCGAANDSAHDYCVACGAPLRAAAGGRPPSIGEQTPASPLQSFPGGAIGAVVAVVGVLVLVGVLLGAMGGSEPADDTGPLPSIGGGSIPQQPSSPGPDPGTPAPGSATTLETDTVGVPVPDDMTGEIVNTASLRLRVPVGAIGTAPLPHQTLVMTVTSLAGQSISVAEVESTMRQQWAEFGGTVCGESLTDVPNGPRGARTLFLCSTAENGVVIMANSADNAEYFEVIGSWSPDQREAAGNRFVDIVATIDWKLLESP